MQLCLFIPIGMVFLLVWNGTYSVKLLTNIERGGIKYGLKICRLESHDVKGFPRR